MFLLTLLLLAACNAADTKEAGIEHFYAPVAGTIVAADSMPTDDNLNNFYYVARISATDSSNRGWYNMYVAYGPNEAESEIAYPALDRLIIPAVKRDTSKEYTYIIGFYFNKEDKFNDYASVTAELTAEGKRQISFKYLKAYYMDTLQTK